MEKIQTKLPVVRPFSDVDEWMEELTKRAIRGDSEAAYELGCRLTNKWEETTLVEDGWGICGTGQWEADHQFPNFF